MSGKGAHINVLGERIRRYYEHLMTDAHAFVDEVRKDLEGPVAQQPPRDGTAAPSETPDAKSQSTRPGTTSRPVKRAH